MVDIIRSNRTGDHMPKLLTVAVPDWLADAAPTSGLTTKEVCAIFGHTRSGLMTAVREGRFPEADWKSGGMSPRLRWHARTIRAEVRRRNRVDASVSKT